MRKKWDQPFVCPKSLEFWGPLTQHLRECLHLQPKYSQCAKKVVGAMFQPYAIVPLGNYRWQKPKLCASCLTVYRCVVHEIWPSSLEIIVKLYDECVNPSTWAMCLPIDRWPCCIYWTFNYHSVLFLSFTKIYYKSISLRVCFIPNMRPHVFALRKIFSFCNLHGHHSDW